jgi:acetyl-CoA acetyltransferase family protein
VFSKAFIPFRGYYSSPFVRWQGSLANQHPIPLAAETTKGFMSERGIDPAGVDYVNFGSTVAQPQIFFGGPWTAALTGCERVPGVWISQACSTSTTAVYQAAMAVELGSAETVLNVVADRCSNGPHLTWPNPNGPGAQMWREDWVQDNFNCDPWAGKAMIATAETVAKEAGLTRQELDEIALRRYEQYQDGMANDRAFQKAYMRPLEVQVSKKQKVLVETDEGIFPTTAEGLAKLQPVLPDGLHTFGAQTHPADGNAAILVTTREQAEAIAPGSPAVQVLSFGYAREKKCFMPAAPVPAARMALERAGLAIEDIKVIKTHNPFAANDAYMAKQFGIDPMGFNNYGSPLIYGHPQGPTAARCVIELIEELALAGGGYGLFTGCAAGDTAAALVLKVG